MMKARFPELLIQNGQGLAAEALKDLQLIAGCQNNLGTIYQDLSTGDRGENLKKAIACYEAAIRGYEAVGLSDEANGIRRYLASLKNQR